MNKRINIILLKTVYGLGHEGSEVNAKPGYARYLLTESKALLNTQSNKEFLLKLKLDKQEERKREKEKQIALIQQLREQREIDMYVAAGDSGRIFGAINSKKISEKLLEHNYNVPSDAIMILHHIKSLGVYKILISFGSGIRQNILNEENQEGNQEKLLEIEFFIHIKDKNQMPESVKNISTTA